MAEISVIQIIFIIAIFILAIAVFNLHYKFGQFEGKIGIKIDNITEQLREHIKKS